MNWGRSWLRDHREEWTAVQPDQRVPFLMEKIRVAHYPDYSQWAHDYDFVERIATRVLGEFPDEEE